MIAWGWDSHRQTRVPVQAQSGVVAIAAGLFHSLAIKNDGSVLAWGDNDSGQTTVSIDATNRAEAVSAGLNHTLALVSPNASLKATRFVNKLILSWPTNAVDFRLQTTLGLTSPSEWTNWSGVPAIRGTQYTITNPISANGRQFFRLVRP